MSQWLWYLASLGRLIFYLDFIIWVVLATSEYSHSSQLQSSPSGPTLGPEPWHLGVPLAPRLGCACCSAMISVVNYFHFVFQAPSIVLLPEVPKLPSVLTYEGVSESVETFPPSWLPPQGAGPLAEILCFFFYLYLLPYLILRKLASLFGSLGSSADVPKVFYMNCSISR